MDCPTLVRFVVRSTVLNIRARMQYRGEFLLEIFNGILWQTSILVFATVILARFPGMAGWSSGEILMMASMRMLSHAIFALVFSNVVKVPFMVLDGKFDGYLTRPLPVYLQVLTSSFGVHALGDLLVAGGLLAWALGHVTITWTLLHVVYLAVAVVSGALLEGALHTAIACLGIRRPGSDGFSVWVDELMSTFGSYPLSIFPVPVKAALTFGLPLAFVAFLPLSVVLGQIPSDGILHWGAVLSPLLGIALFSLTQVLWKASLNQYSSPGG
ncbi:ABC transporter permease [Streptomyces sp. NBC_00247]|uniref:ABC transporter permease n=1 Tax=Streptomyces sp. NBC_00247 TaxID=2975689 RepID=UPI002E28E417|nr:ABC-2 family transporter protein [Streptomyces sp. NBC_00247]